MKKIIAAILAVLYLGTSTGATVHIHYCMDRLVSWDFHADNPETCGKCGMKKEKQLQKNCCKDESVRIKADNALKTTNSDIQFSKFPVSLYLPVRVSFHDLLSSKCTAGGPADHALPRTSGPAPYLLNCVFRI